MRYNRSMNTKKEYLISLYHRRSVIALISGILVFYLTIATCLVKMQVSANEAENRLHYFTVLSNIFSAAGAAFMIPYAAEGIRKKRFTMPRWIVVFQYSCATCVGITMTAAVLLIFPTQGPGTAFGGTDFWLHLVTPLCTMILFQCVEADVILTKKDLIAAQIPYWTYMTVYIVMVIIIGEENGGWSDFYLTTKYIPAWASFILVIVLGFGIAVLLKFIHNKLTNISRKKLTGLWRDNMRRSELLIEAFGLGRYTGAHNDGNDLTVPIDIFKMMSKQYGVSVEELANAFVKGAVDSMRGL